MTRLVQNSFRAKKNSQHQNPPRLTLEQLTDFVGEVVKSHNALANIVKNDVTPLVERMDDTSIVLQAIANVIGVEKVNAEAKTIRIKLAEDESTAQGLAVEKAVNEGRLVKAEAVTKTSLVVSSIKRADGAPTFPLKSYLPFSGFKQEIQPLLVDKKVGEIVQLPENGGSIEVLEIYEEVLPPAPATETKA